MDHYEKMKEHIQNGGAECPVRYAMAMIGQKWERLAAVGHSIGRASTFSSPVTPVRGF